MTGKTFHGEGRRGTVTFSPDASEFISFGPREAIRDNERQLFNEKVDTVRAHARSDSFWGEVVEKIGKKAAEIGTGVLRGYSRHANAAYAYARTGIQPIGDETVGHSQIDTLLDGYGAQRASQPWLKRVTGIGKYVFGAAVPEGPDAGIYVDDGLVRKAGKYISNFSRGFKEKARVYANDFVETLLTIYHEHGHKNKGIRDELGAEQYAENRLKKSADADLAVEFALKEYRRPLLLAA